MELARPADIGDNLSAAVKLLCEWCIAALGDNHRLSGRGYGVRLHALQCIQIPTPSRFLTALIACVLQGKVEKETGDPPGIR